MFNVLFTDRNKKTEEIAAEIDPSEITVDYTEPSPFKIKEYCYNHKPVAIVFSTRNCNYSEILSYLPIISTAPPYFIVLHDNMKKDDVSENKEIINYFSEENSQEIARKIRILAFEVYQKQIEKNDDISEYTNTVIHKALDDLCVSANYTGYPYICMILGMLCQSDSTANECMGKAIYPEVSKKYNASCASIEHSIRTVIGKSWENSSEQMRMKYYGQLYASNKKKPANREFFMLLSETLRRDIEKYKHEKYGE